jgi:DNA-binding transcriptional LysR family regulator
VPRNIDTALLRSFVAVAETGGVTRAAVALHLTQAAVSQQLKRLEDSLGTALFVRDRQRMALTGPASGCWRAPSGCWRSTTRSGRR